MLLCPRLPGCNTFLFLCAALGLRQRIPGCAAVTVLASEEDCEICAGCVHVHELLCRRSKYCGLTVRRSRQPQIDNKYRPPGHAADVGAIDVRCRQLDLYGDAHSCLSRKSGTRSMCGGGPQVRAPSSSTGENPPNIIRLPSNGIGL